MGVQDSQAVFTACMLCYSWVQADGARYEFAKPTTTLESAMLDVELTKGEIVPQSRNSKKNRTKVTRAENLMVVCSSHGQGKLQKCH